MKENDDGIEFWFENHEDHFEDEFKGSKFKHVFIILMAIFLLTITLSYFLLSIPTFNTFIGLLSSEKSSNNLFTYENKTIIFSKNSLEILNKYYENQINHETSLCLKGKLLNNTYFINEIYKPKTSLQTYTKVVHQRCSNDTLITFHTHPYKECLPSEVDMYSIKKFKEINRYAIAGIMCEPYRINFYG